MERGNEVSQKKGRLFPVTNERQLRVHTLTLTIKNIYLRDMALLGITHISPPVPFLFQCGLKTCPDITVGGMAGMNGIPGHSHLGTVSSE